MARKYTKVEELTEVIRARKAQGETNREIGESYGLSKRQVTSNVVFPRRRILSFLRKKYIIGIPPPTI